MFNEKTQAFVVGSYYKHLTEQNGDMGKTVFVKGTQKYYEKRGTRLAIGA